jgi:hypothetical protein
MWTPEFRACSRVSIIQGTKRKHLLESRSRARYLYGQGDFMKTYTPVTREQFDLGENEVVHRPTNASWAAYPGRPEPKSFRRGMLGSLLSDGDDYYEAEVTTMALRLLAARPIADGE